ncbi:hypothetical protein HELRODRAFT_159919 [Helobdella robusta]|uniref:Protein kinase domain-containing protein n=1 Tax=Helobdella robusta TaxID=6412 RepID=T1EPJ9_HELRO|nr:hypothetical protein HELRODRAFT_159919 [Helobdella robusta]ESO05842.1 hypothetical protein HELRODRAFT_159919 [Helobdella robusta]
MTATKCSNDNPDVWTMVNSINIDNNNNSESATTSTTTTTTAATINCSSSNSSSQFEVSNPLTDQTCSDSYQFYSISNNNTNNIIYNGSQLYNNDNTTNNNNNDCYALSIYNQNNNNNNNNCQFFPTTATNYIDTSVYENNYDLTLRLIQQSIFNPTNFLSLPAVDVNQCVFTDSFGDPIHWRKYFNEPEIIYSPTSSYKVLSLGGKGTFGRVLRCIKLDHGVDPSTPVHLIRNPKHVAMKIIKRQENPSFERQAQSEIAILRQLAAEKAFDEKYNIVRTFEFFRHNNHVCVVFEQLSVNLYEFMKMQNFRALPTDEIRIIGYQILTALLKLNSMGLIHADLKPENIMLIDPVNFPCRIKVIDFGSACYNSQTLCSTYLQSRYYRSPEILLGLPFSYPIDVWSLGCVLAELFLGWPLYPGAMEFDQLNYIVQTQGPPSQRLLDSATKTAKFFDKVQSCSCSGSGCCCYVGCCCGGGGVCGGYQWQIKTPEKYECETGLKYKELRKFQFTSLDGLLNVSNYGLK